MSLLVETLRVEDGNVLNISKHNDRMRSSLYGIYGLRSSVDLNEIIKVPELAMSGIFKCRVIYDSKSCAIEFLPYTIKQVKSLRLVVDENICYPYKYAGRDKINSLFEKRGDCDDILIIKGGLVTDSSYANIIFTDAAGKWFTPATYLLPGTRRASLLESGIVSEASISVNDIGRYTHVKLINAMLDIEDTEAIPVEMISI